MSGIKKILILIILIVSFAGCNDNINIIKEFGYIVNRPKLIETPAVRSIELLVYGRLYNVDSETGNIEYMLLESIRYTDEEKLNLELKLKPNIVFHNGDKVTPEDFQFSMEYMITNTKYPHRFSGIKTVEIQGDVLKLELEKKREDIVKNIGEEFLLLSKKYLEEGDIDLKNPMGAGPYKIEKRDDYERIFSLKRNEKYVLGAPETEQITVNVEGVKEKRLLGLKLKEYEIDMENELTPKEREKYLEKNKNFQETLLATKRIEYIMYNTGSEQLSKKEIRQAIAYGINRERIKKELLNDEGIIAQGMILGTALEPIPYDPERAKGILDKFLKEEGYTEGFEIQIKVIGNTIYSQMAKYIKEDLEAIGIKIEIEEVKDIARLTRIATEGRYHLIIIGLDEVVDNDYETLVPLFSSSLIGLTNKTFYSNIEVDNLLTELGESETRKGVVEKGIEVEKKLMEDLPVFPLFYRNIYVIKDKRLYGGKVMSDGLIDFSGLKRE